MDYRSWVVGALFLGSATILSAQLVEKRGSPDRAQAVREAAWTRKFGSHRRMIESSEQLDLCFVGDSLTEFWAGAGKPIWDLEFQFHKAANLGIAADRTEHILYRIQRTDFSKAKPKRFVLLARTNNLGASPPDSPRATTKGIKAVLAALRNRSPESEIVLVSILPSGNDPNSELRKRIIETNAALAEFAAAEDHITFANVHNLFLEESGRWKRGLTIDGTHLTMSGYDVLGRALATHFKAQPTK